VAAAAARARARAASRSDPAAAARAQPPPALRESDGYQAPQPTIPPLHGYPGYVPTLAAQRHGYAVGPAAGRAKQRQQQHIMMQQLCTVLFFAANTAVWCSPAAHAPLVTTLPERDDDAATGRSSSRQQCSCVNASLCLPLKHGPPPNADIHVWSDCGGPWESFTEPGNCRKNPGAGCNSTCNWRNLDLDTITTIGRDVGHSLGVRADGSVTINPNTGNWPDSDLVCHAHAHDVRVVQAVLPYVDQIYPKSLRPHDPCFYQKLLANITAHERLAAGLVQAIQDAGMDGVSFDFEGMSNELDANCSAGFDYGAAHVSMIKTVTSAFHSALPHSTVTLSMGGVNISDSVHAPYLSVYPVPGLALASDGIFIMGYDMNHHHQICADANSPLDGVLWTPTLCSCLTHSGMLCLTQRWLGYSVAWKCPVIHQPRHPTRKINSWSPVVWVRSYVRQRLSW
jgi:hypothetical protein